VTARSGIRAEQDTGISDPNAVYTLGSSRGETTRLLRQADELRAANAALIDRVRLRAGDTAIDLGCGPVGIFVGKVMISERPAEVADRVVPGHWEGDLIMGRRMTAIASLVERHSRYAMLLKLPAGNTAESVRIAVAKRIVTLPAQLRRSLTWDQGKEMAEHVRFTVDTGVQVYFCDPKSPWQRGSNENTNGLLRQYLPRTTDMSALTQRELDTIARSLNGRPRQTLGWLTPSEAFANAVAMTR
jgi:IS30 family transposase